MSTPVDVAMDVDADGHVAVTVDGQAWVPPGPAGSAPEMRLGRTDVPWILDRLLTEHGGPLRVVLHDGGQDFTDVVTRDRLAYLTPPPAPRPDPPPEPEPAAETAPHRPPTPGRATSGWFEADGYTPGEQVALAVIVTRLTADARGTVGFTLPAALRAMVGDVIAIGEESRDIYVNQTEREPATLRAIRNALNSHTRPAPPPGPDDLSHGFRRTTGGPHLGR